MALQPTPDTSKSVAATVSAPPVPPAAPGSEAGPPPGLPPLTGKVTQVHELEAELDRKKAQHQQAQAAAAGLAATAAKNAPPSAVVDSTQPTARSQPSVTTSQPSPISGSVAPSTTSSPPGPPQGGRRGVGGNTSQYNSGTGGNFVSLLSILFRLSFAPPSFNAVWSENERLLSDLLIPFRHCRLEDMWDRLHPLASQYRPNMLLHQEAHIM